MSILSTSSSSGVDLDITLKKMFIKYVNIQDLLEQRGELFD